MHTYEVECIPSAYWVIVKICQPIYFYQHLGCRLAIDVLPAQNLVA